MWLIRDVGGFIGQPFDRSNDLNTEPFKDNAVSQWEPAPKKRKSMKQVTIKLEKRDWLNNVAAIADKTISSSNTALQLAVSAVSSDGAGSKELTFSRSTLERRRRKVRSAIAVGVKESLKNELSAGHKYILHWVGKMMKGRRHVDSSSEYIAVVLTNVVTGRVKFIPAKSICIQILSNVKDDVALLNVL